MTNEEMQMLIDMFDQRLGKKLEENLKPINDRLAELEQGQTKIEIAIENQVDRAIKTIGEGHTILNRKLDEKISLENRVELLENKVSAIEYVIKK